MATAIEYGLIAALIGVAVVGGATALGSSANKTFNSVNGSDNDQGSERGLSKAHLTDLIKANCEIIVYKEDPYKEDPLPANILAEIQVGYNEVCYYDNANLK